MVASARSARASTQRHDRHRGVVDLAPARTRRAVRPRPAAGPSGLPVPRARRASASSVDGSVGGTDDEPPPDRGRAGSPRARSTPVRTSDPAVARDGARAAADIPPSRPANTGGPGRRGRDLLGCGAGDPYASLGSAAIAGAAAWTESSVGVTGVDAAQQRLDQHGRRPRGRDGRPTNAATETSSVGHREREAVRARSRVGRRQDAAAREGRQVGSGRPSPSAGSAAAHRGSTSTRVIGSGCTTASARPDVADEVERPPDAGEHRLGADVDRESRRPPPRRACRRSAAEPSSTTTSAPATARRPRARP